jgi:hypothetical protein
MSQLPAPRPRNLLGAPRPCAVCGVQETRTLYLYRCTGCREILYCGKECQAADRSRHQRRCALVLLDTVRIIQGTSPQELETASPSLV